METVGTIRELWRYPVKSMAGERLDAADVGPRGLSGDRAWAVRDEAKRVIVGGKALPALMLCAARLDGDQAMITLPDGAEVRTDDPAVHARLSAYLGRAVTLCALRSAHDGERYRAPNFTVANLREAFTPARRAPRPEFSTMLATKLAQLSRFAAPPGTYFDAYTLHVVTTASLAALRSRAPGADLDARRFRPNVLVETVAAAELVEVAWCGGTLAAGELVAAVQMLTMRCAMTTRPQPGLGADKTVLRAVAEHAGRCLGVYADVARPGRVRVGDTVRVARARELGFGRIVRASTTALKRLALSAVERMLPET